MTRVLPINLRYMFVTYMLVNYHPCKNFFYMIIINKWLANHWLISPDNAYVDISQQMYYNDWDNGITVESNTCALY